MMKESDIHAPAVLVYAEPPLAGWAYEQANIEKMLDKLSRADEQDFNGKRLCGSTSFGEYFVSGDDGREYGFVRTFRKLRVELEGLHEAMYWRLMFERALSDGKFRRQWQKGKSAQ